MSDFYNDTLLKEEFKLLQQVQRDPEVSRYITISYEDQVSGSKKDISLFPSHNMYPEKFIVKYKMPVYIAQGQRRDDFEATMEFTVTRDILQSSRADNGPKPENYTANFKPFNNHVTDTWICDGNAWAIAKDHGLWYYVLALGALINQDGIVTDHERREHINPAAFDYWVERGKRPVTQIKWPWDMGMRGGGVSIISNPNPNPTPKLTIKKVGSENQGSTVNKISIVKKTTDSTGSEPKKISIIKKK